MTKRLCKCGCGEEVSGLKKYVDKRHYKRLASIYSGTDEYDKYTLCLCGCGRPVMKYKNGRSKQVASRECKDRAYSKKKRATAKMGEVPLCSCGCGNPVEWNIQGKRWNKYINGHSNLSSEARVRQSTISKSIWVEDKGGIRERQKAGIRRAWLEHGEEWLRKIRKSAIMHPNNFEFLFDCLTSKDIKYVGNAKLWVGLPDGKLKNPDFIFGKNKVIELHGDYWHRGEDASELIQAYKEVGYDCLVIWEKEMQDINLVLQKVAEFIGQETWQLSLPLR